MSNDWDDTVQALPGSIDSSELERHAYLVVVRGSQIGKTYPIPRPDVVIGRAAGVDLQLDDEGVSRFHCKLRHEGASIIIEDLDSRNGTYRNGERVVNPEHLAEGDRLQIGTQIILRFTYVVATSETPSPEAETTTLDPLTGTFTRRHFLTRLDDAIAAALVRQSPLSVMLLRIDHFEELVAEIGQQAAKLVSETAELIKSNLRFDDMVARISEGDFAMLSRWASPGDIFMLAERLRASSANLRVPPGDWHVTFSLGIASIPELDISSARELLVAAGSALQHARAEGGNRAILCTKDLLQPPTRRFWKG